MEGSVVGVDASILLYQFCARHAVLVLTGDYAEVLNDFMHIMNIMVSHGISPLVVFDGAGYKPKLASVALKRAERRQAALKLYEEAETDAAKHSHARSVAKPTAAMVSALAQQLSEAGISFMVAPYEADAQLALLAYEGITHYTMSSDQDLIVHGIYRLLNDWDNDLGSGRFFSLFNGLAMARGSVGDLASLLCPLSHLHVLRALRVLAVAVGCDYFKLARSGAASAFKALSAHKTLLGRADVTEDEIVAAVITWLYRNVSLVASHAVDTLPDAIKKAQLAAAAFFHAPAFSVKLQRIVLLSGQSYESLSIDVQTYLGFSVSELNAAGPVRLALGGIDADKWELQLPGYRYVSFPVPGMVPPSLAIHVEPLQSCTKDRLQTYLRYRNLTVTDGVESLRLDVSNQIFRECHVIERQPSIIIPGTTLFALKTEHGAVISDPGMRQLSNVDVFPERPVHRSGVAATTDVGPQRANEWVFVDYGSSPDAFKDMPTVPDALILRHWENRELHRFMKPLVRGEAIARMLGPSQVSNLVWASKPVGREHWIQMCIPASMSALTYTVQILLTAEKPSALSASDLPACIATDPCFVQIRTATCDKECAAGQSGACWHVACLLFILRYLLRCELEDASPTSKLCRWIMPSARWMLQPARTTPLGFMARSNMSSRSVSAVPRLQWNNDPQLVAIGGRSSVALPARERAAPRDDPAKKLARERLFSALKAHFKQESAAEWVWDTPPETLSGHRQSVSRRQKKMRADLLSGKVAVGVEIKPISAAKRRSRDALGVLADAADFSTMGKVALRNACYVWSQHRPKVKMPQIGGGSRIKMPGERVDYAKDYVCPWHGRKVDILRHATGTARNSSHFTAGGQCRSLLTLTESDAMFWWLKKWKLPSAGEDFYDANPEAEQQSGKRKRS